MDEDLAQAVVEPYDCNDPRNEPLPDIIVYQPVFGKLKASIKEAVELLRVPLANSPYKNMITKGLDDEIKHRTKENASEAVMFAVVGNMGSG